MKDKKDKEIRLRVDEDFVGKVDYLQKINGYKNRTDTIRRTVEKEYNKEKENTPKWRFPSEYAVLEKVPKNGEIVIDEPHYPRGKKCATCKYHHTLDCKIIGVGVNKSKCTLEIKEDYWKEKEK